MVLQKSKILPKCVAFSNTYTLSKEQLQFYHDNGYLIIKKFFGLPALNGYKKRFEDFCNGTLNSEQFIVVKDKSLYKPGVKPEEYINKIQDLLYDDVFSSYSEDPRLLDVVTQIIGENITAINFMLINKPPGTPEHLAHQNYRKCMTCHYVNSDSYLIDVNGTRHEHLVKATESEYKRLVGNFTFTDIYRIKGKLVKGVRSNL